LSADLLHLISTTSSVYPTSLVSPAPIARDIHPSPSGDFRERILSPYTRNHDLSGWERAMKKEVGRSLNWTLGSRGLSSFSDSSRIGVYRLPVWPHVDCCSESIESTQFLPSFSQDSNRHSEME
jgi:hypothetical protein